MRARRAAGSANADRAFEHPGRALKGQASTQLPLDQIRVGKRHRKDMGDIAGLAHDSRLAMRFNRRAETRVDVCLKHRGAWAEATACAWLFLVDSKYSGTVVRTASLILPLTIISQMSFTSSMSK
jgi:hypothetical protein